MTNTLTPSDTDYYRRVAELSTVPFWQLGEFHEPSGPERTHVWHWDEIVPELARSHELRDDNAGALQRRALLLRNPGLVSPAFGATQTLVAAYQMLFPGESAPVHALSFSALRFGATGGAARMVVDGERVPLLPGDLVLTPGWRWHGHVHTGGDDPVVWFDGLDVPFISSLRAGFYREAPAEWDQVPIRETAGTSTPERGLAPVDHRPGRHSPMLRYPWDEAYPALRRLMATADDEQGATLEYRNPDTAGPALATIACQLRGVPAHARTRNTRETASAVWFVARGMGELIADGRHHQLRTNDVFAVPAWTWHHVAAADEELILFRMTDRPMQDAFGLYRVETS